MVKGDALKSWIDISESIGVPNKMNNTDSIKKGRSEG
jgi:hypothetical protein